MLSSYMLVRFLVLAFSILQMGQSCLSLESGKKLALPRIEVRQSWHRRADQLAYPAPSRRP